MQLVEDGQPLGGAGLCFICEHGVDRRKAVINTRFQFDPDTHSPLVGPKLVCEHCATAMAELLGLVPKEENEPVVVEVDKSADYIKQIQKDLAALRKPPVVTKSG